MLRRDFLKFLGIASAGAAVPAAKLVANVENLPNAPPPVSDEDGFVRLPNIELAPQVPPGYGASNEPIQFTFRFYDPDVPEESKTVIIHAGDGTFEYTENRDIEYIFQRGELDLFQPGPEWIDFYLDCVLEWVSDGSIFDDIRESRCFDLHVRIDSGEWVFPECYWETLSYDMAMGTLQLSGRLWRQP